MRFLVPTSFAALCVCCFGVAWAQIPGVQNLPNAGISGGPQIPRPGQQTTLQQGGFPGGQSGALIQAPVQPQPPPPSRLENLYTSRLPVLPQQNDAFIQTANRLAQFGYDTFGPADTPQNGTFAVPNSGGFTAQSGPLAAQNGFGAPNGIFVVQSGAPQDSYILGPGDEVVVVLRGLEDQTYNQRVNRDGQIVLPKLAPIEAAGRTLGDFRSDVERRVAQTYISTNAFVSLGELRQVSVLITGDVRSPGVRVLSALATPLDALFASGGIAKTGSLRSVTLMRGNETRTIDLYSVLIDSNAVELGALENGDRIFIPTLQDTVAIAGLVKHPGIFEMKAGQHAIDVGGLIKLAGGYEIGGSYRLSRVTLQPDGSTQVVPVPNDAMISNGEILLVDPAKDLQTETVRLDGAVKLQNAYPLAAAPTVRRLIRSANDLDRDAYTGFAVIVRRDFTLNVRTVIPFSLSRVLSGQEDIPLQNDDMVEIYKNSDIRDLAGNVAQKLGETTIPTTITSVVTGVPRNSAAGPGLTPGAVPFGAAGVANANGQNGQSFAANSGLPTVPGFYQPGVEQIGVAPGGVLPGQTPQAGIPGAYGAYGATGIPGPNATTVALAQAVSTITRENTENHSGDPQALSRASTRLGISEQYMTGVLGDNLVWLFDEVKDPGPYLAAPGTTLGDLVQMAGGPLRTADLSGVEVTSTSIDAANGTARTIRTEYKGTIDDFRRVTLQPLDVVRFRPVFSDRQEGRVTITGEVRYPGTFDVKRGERLSEVLARAGGLTNEAYAMGAIFTRRSAAISESEANQREAKELEVALAAAAQRGSFTSNISGAAIAGSGGAGGATASDVVNHLVLELRSAPALGRITITADPAVLQVTPELDIALEGGDTLYIPKRPSTVTVTGEVLNTGSFAYRNDLTVKDYIAMAGGTRETADDGRTFVVLPDGSARPIEDSWLTFSPNNLIPPGSTIVVPVAVAPFNFLTTLGNIAALTQVTSQLAITAVSLKLLGQ